MGNKYEMHHGEFEIVYGSLHGLCIYPDRLSDDESEEFWIWLDDRLKNKEKLDTLIHELLHAEHPNMSEEDVERTATNIANAVWGEGWREQTSTKKRTNKSKKTG